MEGFLLLGFVIGMAHALEADHLAAVGAMAVGRQSARELALRGAAWGFGHTITLFAICTAVILFGLILTEQIAATLEFAVGVMLVLLGVDVLYRLRKARIHFHPHDHGDGKTHLHAHSHAGSHVPHDKDPHHHAHRHGFPVKAIFVGLLHGAAGSAALLALVVAAAKDPWLAIGYVLLFGLGSIVGMACLSAIAAWPLGKAAKGAAWLHTGLHLAAAAIAILLGVSTMVETGATAFGVA